ncbi:MAG: ribosomal L7Ae/L30e/S12e/Gadd45 family protein [Lachnospiraceae bacterium]
MKQNKILSLLGLATRSRNLVSGEFATENAVKDKSAKVVLIATDASENTKKLFRNKCTFYEVPFIEFGTKESLGHAIGKELRSSLAVTDAGFAKNILGQLEEQLEQTEGNK